MARHILGISAFYHDSAAGLISDGTIAAAAQEERFSRVKHDRAFPAAAIRYCLDANSLMLDELESIIFYESPWRKFSRIIATSIGSAPFGAGNFAKAMSVWIPDKLEIRSEIAKQLRPLSTLSEATLKHKIHFGHHHRSHAASAFFPSPFERAAILCLDGVGEWDTTSAWLGDRNKLMPLWSIKFPHSLGLLYSAFTQYTGFRVNSGEYKLMGLAPYGEPRYVEKILSHVVDVKDDGSFRLEMSYFDYLAGSAMISGKLEKLFNLPKREPESPPSMLHLDIARSIQVVTETIVLRLARTIQRETGADHLCLAGGVALNCVSNGMLLREGPFKDIWVQPAAGDSGGAIGTALSHWYERLDNPRTPVAPDSMHGSFLGPGYDGCAIKKELDSVGAKYETRLGKELFEQVASLIADGNVVGWFSGRMEFGPRALGARSILGDPRNPEMQSIMNLKIKFRESFRPFAPAVLAEHVSDWFSIDRPSPYMLLVAPVRTEHRLLSPDPEPTGLQRLGVRRSSVPAITHVDYSSRIQTVHKETNARFHALLVAFFERTGCPILINTSFNVRGEPIVCTPTDAYRCFMRTAIDYLVIEDYLLKRTDQPAIAEDTDWQQKFPLD